MKTLDGAERDRIVADLTAQLGHLSAQVHTAFWHEDASISDEDLLYLHKNVSRLSARWQERTGAAE